MEHYKKIIIRNEVDLIKSNIEFSLQNLNDVRAMINSETFNSTAKLILMTQVTQSCAHMIYSLMRIEKTETTNKIANELLKTAFESLDELKELVEQQKIDIAKAKENIIKVSTISEMLK